VGSCPEPRPHTAAAAPPPPPPPPPPQASVELLAKGPPARRRASGLAVVGVRSADDAARAARDLDGAPLLGRPMAVRAEPRFVEGGGPAPPGAPKSGAGAAGAPKSGAGGGC
jgi:hypothetical protein